MQICQTTLLVNVHSSKPPPLLLSQNGGKSFSADVWRTQIRKFEQRQVPKEKFNRPNQPKTQFKWRIYGGCTKKLQMQKGQISGLKSIEFESLRKICQRKSAEPDVLRTYCFECPAMWVSGCYPVSSVKSLALNCKQLIKPIPFCPPKAKRE